MNGRTKTYGIAVGVVTTVCLVLIYFLGMREQESFQDYQVQFSLNTIPTIRLAHFESVLSTLQQSGEGEAIFSGGNGFVRFRMREDGSIAVLVPVSASIPCILPETSARFFIADKYKFHNIRIARHERQRLEEMEPLQDAVERKVSYSGTAPHIFIEAEIGSDVVRAAEMTETILTEVFQIGSGQLGTYAGNYRKFRWG